MSSFSPTAEYQKVADANRLFYAKFARMYDATESCVSNPRFQAELQRTLEQVLSHLGKPMAAIAALDACGGTGNVALKLAERGVRVTLSDISEEQIAICREKCRAGGLQLTEFCGEIGAFLGQHPGEFDLVVFASALHHLADFRTILRLAYESLRPGGLILTLYDPTLIAERSRATQLVLSLDYMTFKLLDQWRDIPAAVMRRIKRKLQKIDASTDKTRVAISEENLGYLAEYHITHGIDDRALVREMNALGAETVWHKRIPGGRSRIARKLVASFGDATDFELLLRKPSAPTASPR
jgi:2-polyprenyl-3-methyl-5-hydroxy-6-metoxy-1,4-benzoquinol methylase